MFSKQKIKKKINIFLFYFHILLWLTGAVAVILLPINLVVLGVVLYFLHLVVFNGCIITIWQRKTGGFVIGKSFYDILYFLQTKRHLTNLQHFFISRLSQAAHLAIVFARLVLKYPFFNL